MSELKILTFNLRCLWLGDGINSYVHRVGMIFDRIDTESPDIICFQEATEKNSDFFIRHMPEYEAHYRGREPGMIGEGLMIAVKKSRFELMELDCIWLSPTPYVPGSKFEHQGQSPRILLSSIVRDKLTMKIYRFYDIHLDYRFEDARVNQLHCAFEKMIADRQHMESPCFLMGDFNSRVDTETYAYCTGNELLPLKNLTPGIERTSHGFGTDDRIGQIDFIYSDREFAQKKVDVWKDCEDGIFLSDHYPVMITIDPDSEI